MRRFTELEAEGMRHETAELERGRREPDLISRSVPVALFLSRGIA